MEQTKLEKYLEKILAKNLGKMKGKDYFSHYQLARECLINDVLPNIKAREPELTDHGEKHIENVLNNTWRLLVCDDDIKKGSNKHEDLKKLTCYDLYILCLSILFHDTGNIEGRKDHNKKVLKVYNDIRPNKLEFETEKQLISKVTSAHCGTTKSGSLDTLKDVLEKDSLSGEPIKLRELASILRFADELAEGPQRTSDYIKIGSKSKIHHKYAKITDVFIDRGNERIVVTYNIYIKNENRKSLKTLLSYAYNRLIKLDEERLYTKFYSNLLTNFKKTEFSFNFFTEDTSNLPKKSIKGVLSDTCIIPGNKPPKTSHLIEKFKELNIDNIVRELKLKE